MLWLYWTVGIAGGILLLFVIVLCLYWYALPKFVAKKMRNSDNPDGAMSYPAGYEEMEKRVRVRKDLRYPSKYPSNEYDLYFPSEAKGKVPLLIWVHGGGFIAGTKDGGINVMTALASAGFAVASINYAVAPEYRYPTAVRQAHEFTEHLAELAKLEPGIDLTKLVYCGDSAGAQIASQYLAVQTNSALAEEMKIERILKKEHIRAGVFVCGPFDMPGIRRYAKENNPKFRILVDLWGRGYYGKVRWYDSSAAAQSVVLNQVTKDYPPVFLTDGNSGSFEIQNRRLAESLRKQGVEAEEHYFDESEGKIPHEYLFHLADDVSVRAMEKITDFIRRKTL